LGRGRGQTLATDRKDLTRLKPLRFATFTPLSGLAMGSRF
jgi:hypothetical protein